jgi:hypothetical protein
VQIVFAFVVCCVVLVFYIVTAHKIVGKESICVCCLILPVTHYVLRWLPFLLLFLLSLLPGIRFVLCCVMLVVSLKLWRYKRFRAEKAIPNPRAQVNISYVSIKKLQIMRLWTLWRLRQGIVIVHTDCNDAAIRWATDRFEWERGLKINKPDTPDAPDKWRSFSDGFFGMMSAVRGTMNIPLSYVFHEHVVPTPEIGLAAANLPLDDYLMVVVLLNIPEFTTDNRCAWEHLRPLFFDTPAWEYVKRYDATKDARTAFRMLTLRVRAMLRRKHAK